jgi:hypothetical protein
VSDLTYTLVTDGSSDASLKTVLEWLLRANGVSCAIQGEWADLRQLPRPPIRLEERIGEAAALYPCELLFIHRDAEDESREFRRSEIEAAVQAAKFDANAVPAWVSVIPVRMQEAWLLFDEMAIRRAVGNRYGTVPLQLPALDRCEALADPKTRLFEVFREASGLGARRRAKLRVAMMTQRIAEYVEDFSPLRSLTAFTALEQELREAIGRHRWDRR